ncbi:MAG TPA: GAF domain-containing protein, partial [Aggregatilineaceae bacterium]|nr:GAF domain-containing protein [Aggregatilineaceae bacterium]
VIENMQRQQWPERELSTGLIDQVIKTREPLLNAVPERASAASNPLFLGVPLWAGDQLLGVVALHRKNRFTLDDAGLLSTLASLITPVLQNTLLQNDVLRQRIIELSTIEVLSRHLSATLDLETIIVDVVAGVMSAIGAASGSCALMIDGERFIAVSPNDKPYHIGPVNEGIVGRVLKSQELILLTEPNAPDSGARSVLCVPIVREGKTIGALNFADPRPNAFDESHVHFVDTLSQHAGIAIENARLFSERRRQIEILLSLRTMSHQLLANLNLQNVLSTVLKCAQEIAHSQQVRLYFHLCDPEKQLMIVGPDNTPDPSDLSPLLQQVVETEQSYYSVDINQLPEYWNLIPVPDFQATVYIPMKRAGEVRGVMEVNFENAQYYTPNEIQGLEVLAGQIAVAFESSCLYDEVRSGHDQMKAILDSTREGMLLIDNRRRLLQINAAAQKMLGEKSKLYPGGDFIEWLQQAGEAWLKDIAGTSLQELNDLATEIRHNPDQVTHRQFEQIQGDERHYIDETGSAVLDLHQQRAGWLVVWRDMTEERQIELLREELTNMIIHDLRSPLTAMISAMTLMQDLLNEGEASPDVFNEILHISMNSGENMLSLVQSLLDIARLEHQNLALDCDSFALDEIALSSCSSVQSLAMGAQIRLEVHIPPDLPLVWVDDEKIRRVLINLLDNALRHSPLKGQITINAALYDEGKAVLVQVIDSGPGVPPEARQLIFDKFMQLHHQALRGHKGTGLGLTYCKLAVEAHGGRIWVEEGQNGGAAFCFTVPVVPPVAPLPS